MNHPYTGATSYIYANERQYTPIDPRTKDPYGKRQSFVPRRSTSTPRAHPIRAPHPAPRPDLNPIITKPCRPRLLLVGRGSRGTASASASQPPPPPPLDAPLILATGTQPRCVPAPAPVPQNKYGDALPLADEGNPPASLLDVPAGAYPADTADEDDAVRARRQPA
ncbi:hypothetical protein B0H14DRAFT_3149948 [Mycena olivaceomarginata]|nr:hypothetical protein B0H14DRAFT_3149948 [Mycena olivaceomarginata]